MKKYLLLLASLLVIIIFYNYSTLSRLYAGFKQYQTSKDRARYYELPDDLSIQDITDQLISDASIPEKLKASLINGSRRIVIFKYLSGAQFVAGYYSYLTNGHHPLMLFLRGGNGFFGIMRPNNCFSYMEGFNVVGTLYRGNIYGGFDGFGGDEIEDIENLIKFFPELESYTHTKLQVPFTMVGVSRGAMEMFTALSKVEYVRERTTRAISISGNVDLNVSMHHRPEMKYLFRRKFKASGVGDFNTWIKMRDPVYNVKYLPKSLKVLLIFGLKDDRVSLEEQQNLLAALKKEGIESQLVTIPDADHEMCYHFAELEQIILDFMNQ